MSILRAARHLLSATPAIVIVGLLACAGGDPVSVTIGAPATPALPGAHVDLACTATISTGQVSCARPASAAVPGASNIMIGEQNVKVRLTSSNVSYDSGEEVFQFDVTVQNLMNEAIGTPDGIVPDTAGIKVFFVDDPHAMSGAGSITVLNADGTGTFNASSQPYFRYDDVLPKDSVSGARTWQLAVPRGVDTFAFRLLVSAEVQPLLVINEMLANPANYVANPDANGEWVEIYNAGTMPVNLVGLVFADSAASGRRPYNVFTANGADLTIQPGGYFVIGNSTSTTTNGGAPVNYAYGTAMSFANSLDAFKIAKVYGTDTLTIDRTQYSSAAVSAQDGYSRELKNPALDNSNMDGSNWATTSAPTMYGPGGRGTPGAQNASFTPNLVGTATDTLSLALWSPPRRVAGRLTARPAAARSRQ